MKYQKLCLLLLVATNAFASGNPSEPLPPLPPPAGKSSWWEIFIVSVVIITGTIYFASRPRNREDIGPPFYSEGYWKEVRAKEQAEREVREQQNKKPL